MCKVSRYVQGYVIYPHYRADPKGFISAIVQYILDKDIGTYLPSHEEALVVALYRSDFPEDIRIPLSSYETLCNLHNKSTSMDIAESLNIPIPLTHTFSSQQEFHQTKGSLPVPGIFKQVFSHGSNGVHVYQNEQERDSGWERMVRSLALDSPLPICQEYLEGKRIYTASFLAKNGIVSATFQRRNIRGKELFGGSAVKCESVHHPRLRQHSLELAANVHYTGVAMLEFLVDENTGEYWLMEINPRYWGTISHDIDCGVEYPWLQFCISNEIPIDEHPQYENGLKSRWIIGDIISFLKHARTTSAVENLGLFCRHLDFDDNFFMDLKLDDPLPFFVQAYLYYRHRKEVLR